MKSSSFGVCVAAVRGEVEMASVVGWGDGTVMGVRLSTRKLLSIPVAPPFLSSAFTASFGLMRLGETAEAAEHVHGGTTGLLPTLFGAS